MSAGALCCCAAQRWITFQLLQALSQAHAHGVCHGDIKAENVMVTSWNWVFLTDFASYKPTYLPADNPVRGLRYWLAGSYGPCAACDNAQKGHRGWVLWLNTLQHVGGLMATVL